MMRPPPQSRFPKAGGRRTDRPASRARGGAGGKNGAMPGNSGAARLPATSAAARVCVFFMSGAPNAGTCPSARSAPLQAAPEGGCSGSAGRSVRPRPARASAARLCSSADVWSPGSLAPGRDGLGSSAGAALRHDRAGAPARRLGAGFRRLGRVPSSASACPSTASVLSTSPAIIGRAWVADKERRLSSLFQSGHELTPRSAWHWARGARVRQRLGALDQS